MSGFGVDGLGRQWTDRDWNRLVDQIQRGDCTPFLGAGACCPTLPTGGELSRAWASHYEYPFGEPNRLPEVMQYASIIEEDPVTVKQHVVRELTRYGEPDFTDPTEPHGLLAQYPIKVFLTTNYDDFMTRALEREGKRPVTAVCPWYLGAETDPFTRIDSAYEPRAEQPLVYHLHGSFRYEASLVLAEQDYVEFLVNLARDLGSDDRRVVPLQILPALTRHPLLFVGYSLRDWTFRMLFHGFVGTVADVQRRRHVSVQLAPSTDPNDESGARAEEFLVRYFKKFNISVYWGEASEFCAELADRLRAG
jgi:hypothetical protein